MPKKKPTEPKATKSSRHAIQVIEATVVHPPVREPEGFSVEDAQTLLRCYADVKKIWGKVFP
jgi:hypothetical protein